MHVPHPTSVPFGQYHQTQRDYSNNVLVTLDGGIFFLPAYLRIVFIETNDVNIQDLSALLSATLVITIYYKNLPQHLIPQLNQLQFSAKNVESFILRGSGPNKNAFIINNVDSHTMEYVYKGRLPLRLESNVLMAPFDLINFELLLTFHAKYIVRGNELVVIRLNFMDIEDPESKILIMYKDSNISGAYGLAESSFNVRYESQRVLPLQQLGQAVNNRRGFSARNIQSSWEAQTQRSLAGIVPNARIFNWRFIKLDFQMYRYPSNTLVIIFVPMGILSFINLMIFWADVTDVSSKLQTVAGLMIAYAALLPVIRSKIPPSPRVTLMEYMIYALSLNVVFSSLETVLGLIRYKRNGTYKFVWDKNWAFLLSMSITIATFAILVFLSIIHKLVWEPRYNYLPPRKYGLQFENFQTVTGIWTNPEASEYFKNITTLCPEVRERPAYQQKPKHLTVSPDKKLTPSLEKFKQEQQKLEGPQSFPNHLLNRISNTPDLPSLTSRQRIHDSVSVKPYNNPI